MAFGHKSFVKRSIEVQTQGHSLILPAWFTHALRISVCMCVTVFNRGSLCEYVFQRVSVCLLMGPEVLSETDSVNSSRHRFSSVGTRRAPGNFQTSL